VTVNESARDEGELIRRIGEGDEEAFLHVYRTFQKQIFRFALQMSGSRSLAEDVTQETFLFLIKEPGRFSPARGNLAGFLFGVARNLLRRRLHQENSFACIEEEVQENVVQAPEDALTELRKKEVVDRVRAAIRSLPQHYREVVVLCELHEKSYEEVAGILRCAVGTVRSRLHRARNLLVAKLYESENPGETARVKAQRCLT
jgi:RNA polymerase sigma-70 factor, ECF subfamily